MEQWQLDRKKFYTRSSVLGFIDNYFDVKKGVRCEVGHKKNYKFPSYYKYNNDGMCKMKTLPDFSNMSYDSLIEYNCVHSFMYMFDKDVLNWMTMVNKGHIDIIKESIIGINAILEIDTPYESSCDGARRLDFFDCIDEFNDCIYIIDRELEKLGEDYNIMFSGNGIYVILEGCYDNIFEAYVDNFANMFVNMQIRGLGNPLKVHIDNKKVPWNDYMKIPFTFHEKKPRVSMPIQKGKIDSEWLKHVSNVDNILNDYKIVDDIIDKCGWNKLW